jgi:hypothetical protein
MNSIISLVIILLLISVASIISHPEPTRNVGINFSKKNKHHSRCIKKNIGLMRDKNGLLYIKKNIGSIRNENGLLYKHFGEFPMGMADDVAIVCLDQKLKEPIGINLLSQTKNHSQNEAHHLCVDRRYRNKGIGHNLTKLAEHLSKQDGRVSIIVKVSKQDPTVLQFFGKKGYHIVDDNNRTSRAKLLKKIWLMKDLTKN